MEVTNQDLLQVNEVVSKRWHNLFYILQFCYIFFWLCCFFLMHLATSCYIPIISGYKQSHKHIFGNCNEPLSFFYQFSTHFFDIKGYSKESKVHCNLVFSHMPESSVCHVVFHLSKHSFWFYTPPAMHSPQSIRPAYSSSIP